MNPEVTAAVIAASVSFLTLIGTLAAQYFGRRATSRDTERTLKEQGEQLDRTLAEQRKQLDRTLAEQRTRTLNERFATAAGQLGGDKPPAVRLAGAYALAGLADDWPENRQTCADVLCAYLRLPYDPDPGEDAAPAERTAYRANQEVRHTVIRVIAAHLQDGAAASWQGLNFDFTGVVFDGGDFGGARFSGGKVLFGGAEFSGGEVSFSSAKFTGAKVSFDFAEFSGAKVHFISAEFSGGEVSFGSAKFTGGMVRFDFAEFSGGEVHFISAKFTGGAVLFFRAKFTGGLVNFPGAEFTGGEVYFGGAAFTGGEVYFGGARFSGGEVSFRGAEFTGGMVDFRGADDWSFPPAVPDTPPSGVKLPEEDQSQT